MTENKQNGTVVELIDYLDELEQKFTLLEIAREQLNREPSENLITRLEVLLEAYMGFTTRYLDEVSCLLHFDAADLVSSSEAIAIIRPGSNGHRNGRTAVNR